MAAKPNEKRDRIMAEMRTHLRVHGDRDWHLLRDKYPDELAGSPTSTQHRTFYRWLSIVKKSMKFGDSVSLANAKSSVAKNLPAIPPPSYISTAPNAGKSIDYLAALHEVYEDIEIMRAWASVIDPDSGKRLIKNPVYFDTSIKRRLEVLQTGLSLTREIWDLKLMGNFFDEVIAIIVDEIAPIEPLVARRVMLRLQDLNAKRGMTVHANDELDD